MKLYSDFRARRTAQIAADVVAVVLIGLAIWLGVTVHALIVAIADLGRQIEDAGSGFRETMTDIGDRLGGIPLIGGGVRGPFDAASGAGGALEDAGRAQQDVVSTAATLLGVGVALAPIALILLIWLVPRLRFVRRATEAAAMAKLPQGSEILAMRALLAASARDLAAVDPHPLDRWREGDVRVTRALAQAELRGHGVKHT
ncbi:MAG: hypothetical protein ABW040_05210 [Microbacteriaceae bacterium]